MFEYLIVLNKDEDTISLVDLEKEKEVKKIETDHNPHEVVVTKDGKKTYVTCSLGNTIDVIDNNSFEIIKRITHQDFNFPHGLDLVQQDRKLYVASTYSEKIFIIDTETDEIEKVFPTFQGLSHMVEPSPNGKTLYVPNIGSDNVTIIDVDSEKITGHFPVGKGPEGLACSKDGKYVYVANQDDNTLYVVNRETLKTEYKRRTGDCPIRIVFSPEGRYALIPNRFSRDVSVIDTKHRLKGQEVPWEIKRIPIGIWPGGVCFNDSGSRAFVANNKTNDISFVDMETLEEIKRIKVGIHPDGIAYLKKA